MWGFFQQSKHSLSLSWLQNITKSNHHLSAQYLSALHNFTRTPPSYESLQRLVDDVHLLMCETLQTHHHHWAQRPEHFQVAHEHVKKMLQILEKSPALMTQHRFMESLLSTMIGLSALTISPQQPLNMSDQPVIHAQETQTTRKISVDQSLYIAAIQEALKVIKKLKKNTALSKEDQSEIDSIESKLIALV